MKHETEILNCGRTDVLKIDININVKLYYATELPWY